MFRPLIVLFHNKVEQTSAGIVIAPPERA